MIPTRIALPVPPLGTALSEAGDAYVASLVIALTSAAGGTILGGATFEDLMTALDLRHLCFNARTREAVPGSMPASRMRGRIEARWSSVESCGAVPAAEAVTAICAVDGDVSWQTANL